MQSASSLSYCHFERSGALESRVRELCERLRRCNDRITQCHVTVVGDPGSYSGGVEVRIHLSLPDAQIHADSLGGAPHTDVFGALRDAYDSARDQLRNLKRDSSRSSLVNQ